MANSGKGIWLYFSKKGSLISKIQHGEVIRQGGSFRLIFAFEDVEMIKDKTLTVAFKKPGSETTPAFLVGSIATQDLDSNEHRITFNKIKATEMTYGLKDGERYYCLDFDAPSGYGITEKYGMLNVITKISTTNGEIDGVDLDADGIADNDNNNDTVYFQGSVQLYVEPVYGKQPESSNIPITQYEALLKHIDEVDRKKVNIESGDAIDLDLIGEINAKTYYVENEDGSKAQTNSINDKKTKIKVHNPIEEDEATNKEYVDTTIDRKIEENNETFTEKIEAEFVKSYEGEATNLRVKGIVDAVSYDAKVIIPTPNEESSTSQAVNKEYADTKVAKENGTANNLKLTGEVNAKSVDTYLKINDALESDHPITKGQFDNAVGDLNKLEAKSDLDTVNLVSAINNATTKKEVADILANELAKYVYANDDDMVDIEETESLIYVYKAEIAENDENGENIANNITLLKSSLNEKVSESNVVNLITTHNISPTAHDDIRTSITNLETNLKNETDTKISAAINGLINGAEGAYDTLKEIETAIKNNDVDIANLLNNLSNYATNSALSAVEAKIPTVNNGTLTIQKNGTSVGTFTANQSGSSTINIIVPTNNNELTNGANYITSSGSITGNAATATLADKATKDGSGNVIATTYATKDEISNFVSVQVVDDVLIIG